jgi:hypothetical protein
VTIVEGGSPGRDAGVLAALRCTVKAPCETSVGQRGAEMAKRHGRPSMEYRYEHYDPQE